MHRPKTSKGPDGGSMTAQAIDKIVKKLMDTADVTGLCIGIINDNKPVYLCKVGYGYKNKAHNTMNDTATNFYGASLAKPLFAYTVMQLVQEGVIDLDKPLYTYLPKPIPEYDAYKELAGDDRWKLLTARDCLRHTTGFPNWRSNDQGKKMGIYCEARNTLRLLGRGASNYCSWLLKTVTAHRSLEDLAREKIFIPFHMTKSSFLWQPRFEADYAVGHNLQQDTFPKRQVQTGSCRRLDGNDYRRLSRPVSFRPDCRR